MTSDEILSPPYPNDGSTAQGMVNYISELRKWVLRYRDDLNGNSDMIPKVIKIPKAEAYLSQPVVTQWQHWMMLRRIREEWDHLVRTYELAWQSPMCRRGQTMLVQAAAVMINGAFTPFEHRELQQNKELERHRRAFNRMMKTYYDCLEPDDEEAQDQEFPEVD
jgi:hypothetical protein